jgi:SET domain-containing protein
MKLFISTKIQISDSPVHGLGVFATKNIANGELIEECPFLVLPLAPFEVSSLMVDYRFNYPMGMLTDNSVQVIALGAGSIYNHSNTNNAYWVTDTDRKTFKFYANTDIKAGEEIFTYYGGEEYWTDGRTRIEVK